MPKMIFKMYIDTQKAIFSLPLRCVHCIFRTITKRITGAPIPDSAVETQEINPVTFLTGNPCDTASVPKEMRKLTRECVAAVNRMDAYYAKLKKCKTDLETWKDENIRKNKEKFKTRSDEEELVKLLASAMNYLQTLKARKDRADCIFCENATNFLTIRNVEAKKLLDLLYNLNETEERTNVVKDVLAKIDRFKKIKIDFPSEKSESPAQVLRVNFESLRKSVQDVVNDNINLKCKLTTTNDKLDEVIEISKNLNREVVTLGSQFNDVCVLTKQMATLQNQVDRGQELLLEVEADRDEMRAKLQTLERLIKEEEDFLGEPTESNFGNSCSSLAKLSLDVFGSSRC
ncbi:probable kinetochore protein NUF2 isoform X2 [Stegodyphus dumicola]|nr:probable kinetochore protein NUF2 isoform X2 [Stegodyphus dumicola]